METGHIEFHERLRRLLRKHRAMARGYTTRMRPDGLIEVRPRRAAPPISGRSVLIFLAAFVVFKGFLLANLGPDAYGERLMRLQFGNPVEQAGAFAMQPDPLSALVATQIRPLLR